MKIEYAGAAALVLGTIAMFIVMALHPGHVAQGDVGAAMLQLSLIIHAVAIGMAPVLAFGFYAFARNIGLDKPLPALGLIVYAFGAVTVMLAATMSGLIAPKLWEAQARNSMDPSLVQGLSQLSWSFNQSYALLHAAFFSAAFVIFSLAWPGKSLFGGLLRITGVLVGGGILAWLASGTLVLDVHGMGAVVLAQGTWTLLAALGLIARARST